MSDDERRERLQAILRHGAYSKREINKYVINILNGANSIKASELAINDQEDYIKLILIFLYSKSINMDYDVESLGYETVNNFVAFKDFLIINKVGL